MALFKKLISAVKKLFRARSSSRKGAKASRRSLKRLRPLKRSLRKTVRRSVVKKKPASKKRAFKPVKTVKKSKPQPKPSQKKAVSKLSPKSPAPKVQEPKGILTGEVTHYFSKIMVCVVKVTHGGFAVGDQVRIQGTGGSFTQKVASLQIESQDVRVAPKGQLVGLKVIKPARPGDKVFKV